jgi:hypothetical protein
MKRPPPLPTLGCAIVAALATRTAGCPAIVFVAGLWLGNTHYGVAQESSHQKVLQQQATHDQGLAFTIEWLEKIKLIQSTLDIYDVAVLDRILGISLSCVGLDSPFPLSAPLERVLKKVDCKNDSKSTDGRGQVGSVYYSFNSANGYDAKKATPHDIHYRVELSYTAVPQKLSPSFSLTVIAQWPLACPTADQFSSSMNSGWQFDNSPRLPNKDIFMIDEYTILLCQQGGRFPTLGFTDQRISGHSYAILQ